MLGPRPPSQDRPLAGVRVLPALRPGRPRRRSGPADRLRLRGRAIHAPSVRPRRWEKADRPGIPEIKPLAQEPSSPFSQGLRGHPGPVRLRGPPREPSSPVRRTQPEPDVPRPPQIMPSEPGGEEPSSGRPGQPRGMNGEGCFLPAQPINRPTQPSCLACDAAQVKRHPTGAGERAFQEWRAAPPHQRQRFSGLSPFGASSSEGDRQQTALPASDNWHHPRTALRPLRFAHEPPSREGGNYTSAPR